jgi:two-component sensor histidine kinase
MELELKHKNGNKVFIECSTSLIKKGGKLKGFLNLIRDVTERKKYQEEQEASLKEKEILLQEVHHRVKNNMQVITSLLELQSKKTDDPLVKKVFEESQNRIIAMSLIHETLYHSENIASLDFKTYLEKLVSNLIHVYKTDSSRIKVSVDAEVKSFSMDDAVPVGLILNELVSNSLKHAFPNGEKGDIKVNVHSASNGKIEMVVSDNGVGLPEKMVIKSLKTLGLQLVHSLALKQLRGTLDINRKGGTQFTIGFKTKSVRQKIH